MTSATSAPSFRRLLLGSACFFQLLHRFGDALEDLGELFPEAAQILAARAQPEVGRRLNQRRSAGVKYNVGSNDFYSSGQIPLDEVAAGRLDRFGYIDPSDGGRVRSATGSTYFRQEDAHGGVFKVDAFVTRSLFDLYSNFTFFLHDPVHGDAFQQHDSRLVEGGNAQYQVAHKIGGSLALFTAGANFHDNQINVGLYPQEARVLNFIISFFSFFVDCEPYYKLADIC